MGLYVFSLPYQGRIQDLKLGVAQMIEGGGVYRN